jgi:hypothetical protein
MGISPAAASVATGTFQLPKSFGRPAEPVKGMWPSRYRNGRKNLIVGQPMLLQPHDAAIHGVLAAP